MVEIWAKDFISKINDPETSLDGFTISFDENANVMSLIFFSEDGNIRNVSIWITDACGNKTRCDVVLRIRDNTGMCSRGCIDSDFTGWAVTTCTAPFGSGGTTGVIYDTRNNQSDAPKGCDWEDLPEITPSNWNIDSIRQVFGVALDEFDNIYLGASDVYKTNYTPINGLSRGQIFKCEAPSFRAVPFVALPTGQGELNGIGNLAYNEKNNLLYASNLEDGKIYRINLNGDILDSFDPFVADNGAAGIAPQGEQIWGIQINNEGDDCRLYFARISNTERTIYSIRLNVDGSFPATNDIRTDVQNLPGVRSRITDIAFSKNGNMMITAERGTNFIPGSGERGPHEAQVNKYVRSGGVWTAERQLFVGERLNPTFNAGENSAGGVDFGYRQVGSNPLAQCDSLVWATANLMRLPKTVPGTNLDFILYGMEGIPTSGNTSFAAGDTTSNVYCDLFKDFDGVYTDPNQDLGLDLDDKARIGDVELFRCSTLPATNTSVSAIVAGSISTGSGLMMDGIPVEMFSSEDGSSSQSSIEGYYTFTDLSMNKKYTLSPSKNDDLLDGVSTKDLIHIQRHVLGIDLLESKASLVAGDIDGSGNISGVDLVLLRKAILGHTTSFGANTSWKFVSKEELSNTSNPFALSGDITIEQLHDDMMHNDFVGIKVGDVDDSNSYNLKSSKRSIETMTGSLLIDPIRGAQKVTLSTQLDQTAVGLEFNLELPTGISIEQVMLNGEELDATHFSFYDNSFKVINTKILNAEHLILEIVILGTTKMDIQSFLSNVEQGENRIFWSGDKSSLVQFENIGGSGDIGVFPNPFSEEITVNLSLSNDSPISIEVLSSDGRVMSTKRVVGNSGQNSIVMSRNTLGISSQGLYFLRVTGENTNRTLKLISQ